MKKEFNHGYFDVWLNLLLYSIMLLFIYYHYLIFNNQMKILVEKIVIFLLTFLGYAALHALREGWSYSKDVT